VTDKSELVRLWEWTGAIVEEMEALQDAIAKLAAEDLPDEEAITRTTGSETPPGVRCENDIGD